MKKTLCLFISVILSFAVLPHQTTGKGHSLAVKRNLRVLVLEGTPYDRGLQHGKALKEDIHALVDLWKADIERKYKTEADVFIKKFLENSDFPSAVKRWTPELLEEVRGIANGAGMDYNTIPIIPSRTCTSPPKSRMILNPETSILKNTRSSASGSKPYRGY